MADLTHEQETGGRPSASGYGRILGCRASLPLEKMLRRAGKLPVDNGSSDSRYGDKTHSLCAHLWLNGSLPPEDDGTPEGDEATELVAIAKQMARDSIGDFESDTDRFELLIEERFYINDEKGDPVTSGRFDICIVDHFERVGFAGDYKTGWNDTPQGTANSQLNGAAMFLRREFGIERCFVAIVELGVKRVVGELSAKDIDGFDDTIMEVIDDSDRSPWEYGYKPTPDNCRYCPGRLRCQALNSNLDSLTEDGSIIRHLSDSRLEMMRDAIELLKPLATAVDKEMEARITTLGIVFKGWSFVSGAGKRAFRDAATACTRLLNMGAVATEVFAITKIGIGDAERLHKKISGLKGADAKRHFDNSFDDLISRWDPEPRITKNK
jgi:hypothetical protein